MKKLPFVIFYVSDQYKAQKICDKVMLEIGGMLRFITDCYNNKKICDKAVDNYSHALEFVPDCEFERNRHET